MKTNFCQSLTKQIKYTPQYWLLAARPTSECEVEGEALLAEAGVAVLHDAEVGVVRVLVVHGGDVQLPAHHHQLQVCTAQRAQEDLTITEMAPTSAFTFKTLLRHYAKQVLTHSK